MSEQVYSVFIEGNISAGKSTVGKLLNGKTVGERIIRFIPEEIDKWTRKYSNGSSNILGKFYEELKGDITGGWAFSFQMMVIMERYKQQIQAIKQYPGEILVFERGLETDHQCFASNLVDQNKIHPIQMNVYTEWLKFFLAEQKSKIPKPLSIYIRTRAVLCLERNKRRGREEESSLTIEYLEQLEAKHDKWLESVKQINGEQPTNLITREIIAYIAEIIQKHPYFPEIVTKQTSNHSLIRNGPVYRIENVEEWKEIEITGLTKTWKCQGIKKMFDVMGWPTKDIKNVGKMKNYKASVYVPEDIAGAIVVSISNIRSSFAIDTGLKATIVIGTTISDVRHKKFIRDNPPPPGAPSEPKPTISDIRRLRRAGKKPT